MGGKRCWILSLRQGDGEEECAPLPVTLVSFTARKETTGEQGVAILNWATTEETNSDRFDIERHGADYREGGVLSEVARQVNFLFFFLTV